MATLPQIRGALLEEALMWLIARSGYTPVRGRGSDPTLCDMGGGLGVIGRGEQHQIDAVADYDFTPPFSYPIRLLMEAKSWRKTVGIGVVRQAVGTLKDVSEYWVPSRGDSPEKGRYHYQYAVASTSGFSVPAQRYAYAQDVFLLPLRRSSFLAPLRRTLREAARAWSDPEAADLGQIREQARRSLDDDKADREHPLLRFADACRRLGFVLVGGIAGRAPVLLAPAPGVRPDGIEEHERVKVLPPHTRGTGWRVVSITPGRFEFSFDLPEHVVGLHLQSGELTDSRVLDIKSNVLREIRTAVREGKGLRHVLLAADEDWLAGLRVRR